VIDTRLQLQLGATRFSPFRALGAWQGNFRHCPWFRHGSSPRGSRRTSACLDTRIHANDGSGFEPGDTPFGLDHAACRRRFRDRLEEMRRRVRDLPR